MVTSDAQRRAVRKYQEKIKRIPLDVPKEEYMAIKAAADAVGESINGYIKKAISIRMTLDRGCNE